MPKQHFITAFYLLSRLQSIHWL